MDFQEQIRAAMARHTEFHPKTIDVAKAAQRAYEKRPEVKARRKAYAQSEKGKASGARRWRKYYDSHKEKVREKNHRWYEKNSEHAKEQAKAYREGHKEEKRVYARAYYARLIQNPERAELARQKRREYREAHKEELAKKQREYRAKKRAEKEALKNVQGND